MAALYEQGRVHHVGAFPVLEDQHGPWDAHSGEISPDRLDALAWALTALIVEAPGVLYHEGHHRRLFASATKDFTFTPIRANVSSTAGQASPPEERDPMTGKKNPPLVFVPVPAGAPLTFDLMAQAFLQDYLLHQYRTLNSIRARVEYLRAFFGGWPAETVTTDAVRQYQLHRRSQGAAAATINRELQALHRMLHVAVQRDLLARLPIFPTRLQENPPRQGFFEHEEYLQVRAALPPAFQDVLDFAYYSGWRRNEILYLTWAEVDLPGGVIRLSPHRSKTRTGRVLPLSGPLRQVLERRLARRISNDPRVFRRDGVPVRAWRCALRDACRQAKVPHRLLHDCRRTAARNLIRAGVPERIAMLLTGHKTRAVFDRYNIVNEQELLTAGERLAAYIAKSGS